MLLKTFKDYYYGYTNSKGEKKDGYVDIIEQLTEDFPLSEPQIEGEQNQKEFIALFGAVLRMRNLLSSFDEFEGKEILTPIDFQDYCSRYQDLKDIWRPRITEKEDISNDVVFEIELLKQIEVNIDYILMLVMKYHDTHCEDKEILIAIQKAIDSSPNLRSKKALIEGFIAGINDVDDIMSVWHEYVAAEREAELVKIIAEENLKETETRKYIASVFRNGELKTSGTDIDKIMKPMSRFGGSNRTEKKQAVIKRITDFFERFFGIGGNSVHL